MSWTQYIVPEIVSRCIYRNRQHCGSAQGHFENVGWPGFYQDSEGNFQTHAVSKEAPDWFNTLESKSNGGKPRTPPNRWLSELDAKNL